MSRTRQMLRHYLVTSDPKDRRRRLFVGVPGHLSTDLDAARELPSLAEARRQAAVLNRRYPDYRFSCVSL